MVANRWLSALKTWNGNSKFCVPKRRTRDYKEVKSIMKGEGKQAAKTEKPLSTKDKKRQQGFDAFEKRIQKHEKVRKAIPLRNRISGDR